MAGLREAVGERHREARRPRSRDQLLPDAYAAYLARSVALFADYGAQVQVLRLEDTLDVPNPQQLAAELARFDIVFLGGGNTFVLRDVLHRSRFDRVVRDLLDRGVVLAGESAGAIVMARTIGWSGPMDEPELADQLRMDGLNLAGSLAVIPHWNGDKYGAAGRRCLTAAVGEGLAPVVLEDGQALVFEHDGSFRLLVRPD